MSLVELKDRYPESRREDITDAYMRGFEQGRKVTNEMMRRLAQDLFEFATDTCLNATNGPEQMKRYMNQGLDLVHRMDDLGCEVRL